jgi:Na+-transporting NADH:ubiquinone oxidoreductase subunit NqrF
MVYIGGGAGMAPLRSHIFELFKNRKPTRKVSYWYGGRSIRELFYIDHFRGIEEQFPNFKFNIALVGTQTRGQLDRLRGLYPPSRAGKLSQKPSSARGHRVLFVWTPDDECGCFQDAR